VLLTLPKIRLTAALALTISYLPGVVWQGIWSDDYPTLVDPESHQIHASRDGRPVFGILLQWTFGLARDVDDLWVIRLIALIGLILTCNLVLRQLMSRTIDLRIFVSVIGAFSIASFQISVHFATAFVFTWVAYLSLLGFLHLVNHSWRKKLIGGFFLTICSLTYPIFVFFLISVIFLLWYENDKSWRKLKTDSFWGILGIFVSAILALVINIILVRARGLEFNDRVSIISFDDFLNQTVWFITHPFVLTFRGYFISSPEPLQAFVGFLIANILIFIGIFLKLKKVKKSLTTYIVLMIFTLLSMAPLFFPDQQQIDMRYVATGTWLISYMLVSSIYLLLTKITLKKRRFKANYITVLLILIFSLSINHRYFTVIQPIYNETKTFISNAVKNCTDSQISNGVYVTSRTSEWPSNNYIGMFSQVTDLASSWVPLEAIKIEIRENSSLRNMDILVVWEDRNDSGCTIDLNEYSISRK
jgi:hypothetical protein